MTDQAPRPPVVPYIRPGYTPPPPNPRPTSVTVLSIIGIIFGALGTLGGMCGIVGFFMPNETPDPFTKRINENAFLHGYQIVSTVLGWFASIALLAASIASLQLSAWARRAMVWIAVYSIVAGIIGIIVMLTVMLPAMLPLMNSTNPREKFVATFTTVLVFIFSVVGFVYPIFVLVYFRRDYVREAFGELSAENFMPPPFPQM